MITETKSPELRARERAEYLSGLIWHAGTYVIINVFLWGLDLFTGAEGAQWAFWVTAGWGLALAFHALAYYVDGRQLEESKIREYLEEEQR